VLRFKRRAAPVRSANDTWILDCSLQARGCKDARIAITLDQLSALVLVPRSQTPCVIPTECCWRQRAGSRWERLRGPTLLAGHIRLGHWPFFHRKMG
jgi:hypothetical protein